MKGEFIIIVSSIFLVLIVSLLIFSNGGGLNGIARGEIDADNVGKNIGRGKLTGLVISDDSINLEVLEFDLEKKYTEEEALNAIKNVEEITEKLRSRNFSVDFIEDVLIEAKRIFEQVQFAEILRSPNSTSPKKIEANRALRLVDWKNITYNDVIDKVANVKKWADEGILLKDVLSVRESEVSSLEGELYSSGLFHNEQVNSEEAKKLFGKAKTAFEEGRYDEANELLEELREVVENERAKTSGLASLKSGSRNFIQRYWVGIILLLSLMIIGGVYLNKGLKKKFLKRKVNKMYSEKKALIELMKKAQTERFKDNKISRMAYDTKIKKYNERMSKIKQELPVLESRLRGKKLKRQSKI